jgi:CheY-like chemotaxis protein
MTAPIVALPLSTPYNSSAKKKRVLLLDTSQTKRDLRADVMRKLGIDVDCAADVLEARSWWRADLYNLVLISVAGETESRDKFCTDLRSATPPQKIAFFVGGPEYLAAAPHSDQQPGEGNADALNKELVAALLAQASDGSLRQRWGILEACKRISSVRSISEARSRAIRETPRPSRWADAIEQYSTPEAVTARPALFANTAFPVSTDVLAEAALTREVLTKEALTKSASTKEREEVL